MGVGLDGPGTCDIGGWKPPILVFLPTKAALCLEMRSWRSAPPAIAPYDHVGALAPGGMLVLAGDPLRPSGEATRGAAAREPPAVGTGMRQMQGEQGAAAAPRPQEPHGLRRCADAASASSTVATLSGRMRRLLACRSHATVHAAAHRPPPFMPAFRTRRQNSRCASKL